LSFTITRPGHCSSFYFDEQELLPPERADTIGEGKHGLKSRLHVFVIAENVAIGKVYSQRDSERGLWKRIKALPAFLEK
jgi:hypothetical protein